jgi:hypothetical protein
MPKKDKTTVITRKSESIIGSKIVLDYPTISFPILYHIGTLNPEDKGNDSYEGAGLSITTVPDAWMRITSLRGNLHALTKPNNVFLHFHKMKKVQRKALEQWGIEQGYIVEKEMYRIYFYNEDEQKAFMEYGNKEEAILEKEEYQTMRKVKTIASTIKMDERVRSKLSSSSSALQLLATIYVEDILKFDGVWWADILDVYAYSAPRGVIPAYRLSEWVIEKDPDYESDDE